MILLHFRELFLRNNLGAVVQGENILGGDPVPVNLEEEKIIQKLDNHNSYNMTKIMIVTHIHIFVIIIMFQLQTSRFTFITLTLTPLAFLVVVFRAPSASSSIRLVTFSPGQTHI